MGEIPARISEEIMNETVKVLFGLIGGLAMFLFGMNAMSEALQKAAGERMKKILQFLTKNPLMGALAGALVTAVLQSSSATTVMTIGFVSAGLMSLPQAISVVFGANIGTTMTAQLIAFKISDYIYPIIFVGFLLNFAAKKERTRSIGMVIFSFGLLFEGIEIMSSVMKPLAGSAFFLDLMSRVQHIPVLGVLLGLMMTLVVQSSSATIAVLQSFASQPGPDGVSSVIGLIGAIQAFQNGLLLKTPQLLQSALFSKQALAATVDFGCLLLVAVIDVIMLVFYILSFFNLTNSTKRMRNLSLVGIAVSLLGFAVPLVMKLITPDSALASVSFGFGGLLCAAMFLVQFFLNRALLKKGIEPTYREFDPKRRELLHQVRRGEVDIDSLPLPIYESKEEHEERMKALALPGSHAEG